MGTPELRRERRKFKWGQWMPLAGIGAMGALLALSVLIPLNALPVGSDGPVPDSPPEESAETLLYSQALAYYREGNLPEAVALLEQGLRDYPRRPSLASLLGWCHLRDSRLAQARRAFETALGSDPQAADALNGLGYVALREKNPAQALDHFSRALAQNPESSEAWMGLGMARRERNDGDGARAAFERAVALNPEDPEARKLLEQTRNRAGIREEQRRREPVSSQQELRLVSRTGAGYLEVQNGGRFRPLFVKGVNLGTALPGKFPADFPDDENLYQEWFDLMGEMGANVVRLYTLHPPSLYRALKRHNRAHPDRRLWLVQGVWTELPENDDYDDARFLKGFEREITRVIDAVHGNLELPARPGHAHGSYDTDVSEDLLAYLLGREWEPYSVVAYEKLRPSRRRYDGRYVRADRARPFEAWLASICDRAARHETEFYRWQHPVAYVSWPTLDPLHHPTEATREEEMTIRRSRGEENVAPYEEYENDAVDIDSVHIRATSDFPAGFFAAYHAYPYYPEFMVLDPEYGKARDREGSSRYLGYLKSLKKHHGAQPVLIAEFGVPSSRGIAHLQPEGQHHGGHTVLQQGEINARLFRNIHEAGLAGGILFAWLDEWFKRNWLVMKYESPPQRTALWLNVLDAEQNYGLLAAEPGEEGWKIVVDGKGGDWEPVEPLYIDVAGARNASRGPFPHLRSFRVTSDEAYVYLRLDLDPNGLPLDWRNVRYWVGIDTYDPVLGDHRFPSPVDVSTPIGMEFLVQLAGDESRILVDRPYDLFSRRNHRPHQSVENRKGDFIEIKVFTQRDRYGRDGTYYPAQGYSRSPLRYGSMDASSPRYDSLAEWMESPSGDFIEARLPWGLLNVADPSSRQVVHEQSRRKGVAETRTTDGFRFHLLALQVKGEEYRVIDQLPSGGRPSLADYPTYRWEGWDQPRYHLKLKESYTILKEALREIPGYADAR